MVVITRSASTMTPEGALEHVLGNVLAYPENHQVRIAFKYFGVTDINSFTLFKDDDFTLPYNIPDPTDVTKVIEARLPYVNARRLNSIIAWFYSQPQPKLSTWYTLTTDSLQEWYDASRSIETQPEIPISTPTIKTF